MFPTSQHWLQLAIVALLTAFTILNVFRFLYPASLEFFRSYTFIGDDFPNELPLRLDHIIVAFNDTMDFRLHDVQKWQTIFPGGGGWVNLGPQGRPFSVSMFHQLHCLNGIRHAISQSSAAACNNTTMDPKILGHTSHCFNFLRQALLCKADTTLEPTTIVDLPKGAHGAAASGNGVLHRCVDYPSVYHFLERKHAERTALRGNTTS
ncbi:hypothetical protein HETIRDRAFT_447042 [Heterobasidion irregulare TC 32-1]|uniref:Oxidase ustYa n=1 Tax=Heterobasidion irregulare (strain TC 32-1) TaxID=747525 RepID=W4JMH4_HETIT|nr:uncharacterized protein HETIRDRAFT_447042 [Heterobasidion irregulare TC 32-1]ETW74669.1 hypothetical protein HETIRDRAFT_447042 [Heterobasidion irregulare TC 32-1]